MRFVALALFALCLVPSVHAQESGDSFADSVAVRRARYDARIAVADSLYASGDFAKSVESYARAFEVLRLPSGTDLYNAACSAALSGQIGRAYGFLHRAFDRGWADLEHAASDPDLAALREHEALWAELDAVQLRAMRGKIGPSFDEELASELEAMYLSDQGIRREWRGLSEQFANDIPDSINARMSERMEHIDSENLARVEEMIAEHGWPLRSVVGRRGADAAFLIVQHGTLEAQERYLPLLQAAADAGEADLPDVALMIDRVRIRKGLPQLYGSQLRFDDETNELNFFAVEDPENVDARRATMGLGRIADYARRMGTSFDPERFIPVSPPGEGEER